MSEHEDVELPPMSASMRQYVDAFAAVERPEPGMELGTWQAIETQLEPPRRGPWVIGGAALAVAAAVALVVLGPGRAMLQPAQDEAGAQAQREGGTGRSGGAVRERRPGDVAEDDGGGRSRAGTPAAPDPNAEAVDDPEPADGDAAASEAEAPGAVAGSDANADADATSQAEHRAPATGSKRASPKKAPRNEPPASTADADASEPEPGIGEELALMKRAKAALDAEHPGKALSILDEYRAAYPKGGFGPEATVLRAQALCAQGHAEQANAVRDRFVAAHPTSTLGDRMRCD